MSPVTKMLVLSVLSGSFFMANAHAAGKMKPGLWEMRMQSDAIKAMPKMPPEQIEQMKKMGIKMPTMQDGAMKNTVCISKEMAEQNHPAAMQKNQPGCKPQNIVQNGNEYAMELLCDSPELKGLGTVRGSFNGSDSMRSTYDFKGTSHNHPVTQHMETTGKWLSADCGQIKPASTYQKKK